MEDEQKITFKMKWKYEGYGDGLNKRKTPHGIGGVKGFYDIARQ